MFFSLFEVSYIPYLYCTQYLNQFFSPCCRGFPCYVVMGLEKRPWGICFFFLLREVFTELFSWPLHKVEGVHFEHTTDRYWHSFPKDFGEDFWESLKSRISKSSQSCWYVVNNVRALFKLIFLSRKRTQQLYAMRHLMSVLFCAFKHSRDVASKMPSF